jgi:HK97 family phage major capsid protein
MKNPRELRQQRAKLLRENRDLLDKAQDENRDLTTAERTQFDDKMAEIQRLENEIRSIEGNFTPGSAGRAYQPMGNGIWDQYKGQDYSLLNVIRGFVNAREGRYDPWSVAGKELEISKDIAQRLGREPQGLFVPMEALSVEHRDLVKGTPSAGGDLVATDVLAGSFIELLRNRMVVRQAGATVLGGLVGDVAIPRQTGAGTAYWLAESGAPTESQQAVDQVPMSPKTVGAFTDISRKLLKQSSIDVEMFVRGDLAQVLSLAIDRAALHGDGTGNQPTGIASTSGIGSVAGGTNGAAPTWANIVQLESEVSIDNADVGRLAYVTNTKVRGKLKVTPKESGQPIYVWGDGPNPLNGYSAYASNQVRSDLDKGTSTGVCSAIFFGNWGDLVIGMWGVLDILVDPYTGGTSGTVRVITLQDVDIAVRHAQSFSAMLDALTA